jgi:hypothetical protein
MATSPVRVASMPNGDDVDHRSRFDDPIDDAIVAGANAVQIVCACLLSDGAFGRPQDAVRAAVRRDGEESGGRPSRAVARSRAVPTVQ